MCGKRGEHHARAAEEATAAAVAAAGVKLGALNGQQPRPGVVEVVIYGQRCEEESKTIYLLNTTEKLEGRRGGNMTGQGRDGQ